jgi:hypothetical protein
VVESEKRADRDNKKPSSVNFGQVGVAIEAGHWMKNTRCKKKTAICDKG